MNNASSRPSGCGSRLQRWRRLLATRRHPASPTTRTFARTSSGGLGGSGEQQWSNTRCQPGPRRGCPGPDPSGPPCSHARASGPGTAGGCGSGHARRPQAPIQEPPLRGQPRRGRGHGSPCGCARVSRRLQRSARRVRCPTRERGRGRARSEAPSRAAPAGRRTGTAARAATQERSALGCSSSSEGAPRPHARAPRSRGGPGRRRGTFAVAVAKRPASAGEPGTPEARRANAPPEENAGAANAPRVEAGEAA